MSFTCNHLVVRTTDIGAAREFYVDKLQLELLEGGEFFLAVKAGDVRFSFFKIEAERPEEPEDRPEISIVLRTDDVEKARDFLQENGVTLAQDIVEAPNFMRFLTVEDPDGNVVHVAEYLADPLVKKI